jgi:VWFA-related protein
MRFVLISSVFALALVSDLFAQVQSTYSESIVYTPRVFEERDKKKKDEKTVTVPAIVDSKPISLRVSVLDNKSKAVTGLSKENFKLFVDGKELEIASIETRNDPMNFVLMIDISPSSTTKKEALLQKVERVIDQLAPDDRAMAIAFSSERSVISEFTDDRSKLRKAVSKAIKQGGNGTAVYELVQHFTEKLLPKMQGPTAAIFFTDGVDTTSRKARFDTSLVSAEQVGVAYYLVYLDTMVDAFNVMARPVPPVPNAILVSRSRPDPKQQIQEYEIGKNYLNDLMAASGGYVAHDGITGATSKSPEDLLQKIRSQYVVTFVSQKGSVQGQRHSVNIRVDRPNLMVVARGSFIAQ